MAQPADGLHRIIELPNQAQATSPPSCVLPPAPVSFPARLLVLRDGTALQISADDIPDPPAVSFADDIPRLNSMWDDMPPHWCGRSPLVVRGHPIPVSYWPELYKYGKKDQWKGTKGKWFEWKVCLCFLTGVIGDMLNLAFQVVVECYRERTPEDFWREFRQPNGNQMTFTTITQQLRKQQIARHQEIVAQAQREYGPRFSEIFTYRRGGQTFVMSDPSAIARHYLTLHEANT